MKSILYVIVSSFLLLSAAADSSSDSAGGHVEWGNTGDNQEACATPEMLASIHQVLQDSFNVELEEDDDRRMLRSRSLLNSIWCDICDFTKTPLSLTCLVYFRPCTGGRRQERDLEIDEEAITDACGVAEDGLKALSAPGCDSASFYVKYVAED